MKLLLRLGTSEPVEVEAPEFGLLVNDRSIVLEFPDRGFRITCAPHAECLSCGKPIRFTTAGFGTDYDCRCSTWHSADSYIFLRSTMKRTGEREAGAYGRQFYRDRELPRDLTDEELEELVKTYKANRR